MVPLETKFECAALAATAAALRPIVRPYSICQQRVCSRKAFRRSTLPPAGWCGIWTHWPDDPDNYHACRAAFHRRMQDVDRAVQISHSCGTARSPVLQGSSKGARWERRCYGATCRLYIPLATVVHDDMIDLQFSQPSSSCQSRSHRVHTLIPRRHGRDTLTCL